MEEEVIFICLMECRSQYLIKIKYIQGKNQFILIGKYFIFQVWFSPDRKLTITETH